MTWIPKLSLSEATATLCAPGQLHELETRLVDGRIQRVYKNLWPSLRHFWLWAASQYQDLTYIVFEGHRLSYKETFQRSLKAASIFKHVYGVQKGNRVVICSRNFPDYLVAFWACYVIGAVPVLVNAWLQLEPTRHCLVRTQCKLAIVDPERADMLENDALSIAKEAGTTGFLVWEHREGKGEWKGMGLWSEVLDSYKDDARQILREDPGLSPEDNAVVVFTSGTTGLPKGVLSTHRMFLTNLLNVLTLSRRALLRRGDALPSLPGAPSNVPQAALLISVPLFHVTGSTSLAMIATFGGMKVVFMRRWIPDEGARLIKKENVTIAGGVPSMVSDLINSASGSLPLTGLLFGGAPAPDWLVESSRTAFPSAIMYERLYPVGELNSDQEWPIRSQAYGLTETNSVAVGFSGEDYAARPTSAGLAAPVCDILIVKDDKAVPPGEMGEVWLRGPNVMKGYWGDAAATAAAITQDGWLRTGDIGYVDHEQFLYIRDRIKDLIIRGGENIDSVSVENAVSADDRLLEVAAVAVPDKKLGELVSVVASVKPPYQGKIKEEEVIDIARKRLPRFAVPVMVLFFEDRLPRNPAGKILKNELRNVARAEWEKRLSGGKAAGSSKL